MFDFCISEYGELVYNGLSNDIKLSKLDDLIKQKAICRIKSVTKDWFNAPEIGADIEKFLGSPNNEATAEKIVESITYALTFDELIKRKDLFFIPKIDINKISIIVFIKRVTIDNPIIINVEIDIISGVNVKYDINS